MNPNTNQQELQRVVSKAVLGISLVLFLLITLNDLSLGFYLLASIKVPIMLVYIWAIHQLNTKGYSERNAHIVFVPILVFLVINYINNHGTDGPTVLGSLALFLAYPIILSKRWMYIYSSITLVLIVGLLYLGTDENNLSGPKYENEIQRFIDYASTFVLMAIYFAVVVNIVIHYYKKQNQQLIDTEAELKINLIKVTSDKKQKENLLGILAHDVKSPIHTLGQLIALYKDNLLSQEELKDLLGQMQHRMEDVERTVKNILDQIKQDLNKTADTGTQSYPVNATEELIHSFAYKLETKNQRIEFEPQIADEFHAGFAQHANDVLIILKNLIDNAIKYSPKNAEIKVVLSLSGSGLQWDVIDQGSGLKQDVVSQLFAKNIHSTDGSGVGLYLCKSIADSIGAELDYIPQEVGSCFRLRF